MPPVFLYPLACKLSVRHVRVRVLMHIRVRVLMHIRVRVLMHIRVCVCVESTVIQFEVPNEERSELKVESDAVKFVVSWNFQKLPGTLNIE